MALTSPASVTTGSRRRLAGPDVVRAVALIGVVAMNYHGYLIIRGGERAMTGPASWFDPWTGPLSTRFAATFVLVAGVGVTLLTRSSLGDPDRLAEMRWRLVRRGALLYVVGLWLDTIWPGTIIPYYGAMFVLAALLFTASVRVVAIVGAGSAAAAALLQVWKFRQGEQGQSTDWLFAPDDGSPSDLVFGVIVNGTHPLLPWLAFFCAGILLGRVLDTTWWQASTLGAGLVLFTGAAIAESAAVTPFQVQVLSTNPSSRSLAYTASALGTALIAYVVIDWLANRFANACDPLRRAGQMSLSLYLLHIFVFELAVDRFGLIEPGGLATSLTFALGFWVMGIALAVLWHRRFGRGPAERVYRTIGG